MLKALLQTFYNKVILTNEIGNRFLREARRDGYDGLITHTSDVL